MGVLGWGPWAELPSCLHGLSQLLPSASCPGVMTTVRTMHRVKDDTSQHDPAWVTPALSATLPPGPTFSSSC